MESVTKPSRRSFLLAASATVAASGTGGVLLRARPTAAATGTDTVRASDFGHDPADSTRFLQAALDSGASTVVIDNVIGGWLTQPLFVNRSGVTVLVEPDVMVRAVPKAFTGANDKLLSVIGQSNVCISGYGATLAMNKGEYTTGEYRGLVYIYGSENVTVEGLTLRDSGGDGVYVGPNGTPSTPSRGIVLRDLTCDNNRRNAVSVTSVDGLLMEGCALLNTNGTSPQSGLDFEPSRADQYLANIAVRDCVFDGNGFNGFRVGVQKLDATSAPMSLLFERLSVGSQAGRSGAVTPSVLFSGLTDSLAGSITFRDSLIDVCPGSGGYEVSKPAVGGPSVTTDRVTIWDVGNTAQNYGPIELAGPSANYGGLTLRDTVVVTDQVPFVISWDGSDGTSSLTDVHGTLLVTGPNGAQADFGHNPVDVDVAVRTEAWGTRAQVGVRTHQRSITAGSPIELVFQRRGGDLSAPLAVAYSTSGTARERYDYAGMGKVAVIPPGEREVTITVQTYPRRRDSDPKERSFVASLMPGYRYGPDPAGAVSVMVH